MNMPLREPQVFASQVRSPQSTAVGAKPLRIVMLGLRGFPDVQGGVERHVEHLSRRLVELGCEVEAIVRSPYMPEDCPRTWHGVKLHPIWSPRVTGVEALVHSFLGVFHAARIKPDILHIHSIGPALFAPLARALGLRVVVTHHVMNYENEKWGPAARTLLRLGERIGMTFSHARIAVSRFLADRVTRDYAVSIRVIPNGLGELATAPSTTTLQQFGLTAGRYLLTVARIDPQKCQLDLIEAFRQAQPADWTLALAGAADYASDYVHKVVEAARRTPGVVLLGHQKEAALAELYGNAGAFVLPSSHEGQPIAVIEALGYGCPVILSDIPAHRELGIVAGQFFPSGDVVALSKRLRAVFRDPPDRADHTADRDRILKRHDWRLIARHTLRAYCAALPPRRAVGIRLGLRDQE
ncbi:MAG: glycosyltransferase family 4 protein [Xanthobacteraceae bacterium]|nr:glycosyltransferase family 4 protein [Xanthobacteraceae bacterium]